jgi:hypothetical protein
MNSLADHWLSLSPPEKVYRFLQLSFRELQTAHGRVVGTKIRRPNLVPLTRHQASLLAAS